MMAGIGAVLSIVGECFSFGTKRTYVPVNKISSHTHKDIGALVVVDGLIPVESRRVAVSGCQAWK